jgi:hypothetical protein
MDKRKSGNPTEELDLPDHTGQEACTQTKTVDYDARLRKLLHQKRVLERKNRALTEEVSRLSARLLWLQEKTNTNPGEFNQQLRRENFYYLLGLLHAVLIREPDNLKAMANLADVFAELGFYHKAIDVLKTIIEKDPNNEEAKTDLIRLSAIS